MTARHMRLVPHRAKQVSDESLCCETLELQAQFARDEIPRRFRNVADDVFLHVLVVRSSPRFEPPQKLRGIRFQFEQRECRTQFVKRALGEFVSAQPRNPAHRAAMGELRRAVNVIDVRPNHFAPMQGPVAFSRINEAIPNPHLMHEPV